MADPDKPFKRKDPYEDDVSWRPLASENTPSAPAPGKYLSPMWSLLTVIALFAVIVLIAISGEKREQQTQQRTPQTQTAPSTTGSAPAR